MTGYKVFKVVNKQLRSITTGLVYKLNTWNKAGVGKLFYFKELEYAKNFVRKYYHHHENEIEVWEVEVVNGEKCSCILSVETKDIGTVLERFWEANGHKKVWWIYTWSGFDVTSPPYGTMVADKIKLIRRVL